MLKIETFPSVFSKNQRSQIIVSVALAVLACFAAIYLFKKFYVDKKTVVVSPPSAPTKNHSQGSAISVEDILFENLPQSPTPNEGDILDATLNEEILQFEEDAVVDISDDLDSPIPLNLQTPRSQEMRTPLPETTPGSQPEIWSVPDPSISSTFHHPEDVRSPLEKQKFKDLMERVVKGKPFEEITQKERAGLNVYEVVMLKVKDFGNRIQPAPANPDVEGVEPEEWSSEE